MICTAENVRQFILNHYADKWASQNIAVESVPDTYDLLSAGIVDSIGVLELIGAIEDAFDVEVDLQDLEAEQVGVIGALSKYVEAFARPRTSENGAGSGGDR